VREQEAADLLARVGARDVEVTGDPVLLSPPPGLVAGAHPDGPIGLNLRPTIAEGSAPLFAEELVASLARVGSVLPIALHAGPDVPVLRRALPGVEVFAPADPDALVRQLSGCGALVSMRLHALILGATLGMPSVGLSYHPKVERFARSVGTFQALDCVALPPGRVADEVVRLLAEQRQGDAAERRARVGALRARGLEAFRRARTRLPLAPPCA